MGSFDEAKWRERARSRRAKSQQDNAARLQEDLNAISALRVVVEWCSTRGLTVDFCRADHGYYGQTKLIIINSRVLPETQLHYLLHECGHHLVDMCTSDRKKRRRWSNGYGSKGAPPSDRDLHAIEVIDEEYEAWDRGSSLAARLGLELNTERFHRHKVVAIKSYFKWALRGS